MASYDAAVIGAGHNGLVCAAYLARAGLRVVVLERSDRVGGACVTEEPWPGYRISTAAHSLSLLAGDVVSDLGLRLDVVRKDPRAYIALEGGRGITLWEDAGRRAEEISRVSADDARGYEELLAFFERAARRFRPMLSYPATRRQVMRALRAEGIDRFYGKVVTRSVADAVRDHLSSDAMQGFAASAGVIGSAAGPETPGTAYLFLHHHLGLAAGASGVSGSVRGGLGAVAEELARAAREAGCDVRVGTEVAEIKLDKRRAAGVVLTSGEEIDAAVVCSCADAKRTVALVDEAAWLREYVEDVSVMPTEGAAVKVNCALGALPRFRGSDGDVPGPEHHATVTIAPSIAYLEEACRTASVGRPSPGMFCKIVFESVADPSMAPDGKHTMSVLAQYAPYSLAEGSWDERREEIGDLVLATIERYAPGVSDLVEERQVLGPPDIERRFGLTGGHIHQGEMLPDWLFDNRPAAGWNRHRTPLPGLYLCGASTHPGGGVSGAPGRNAARAALEDRAAAGPPGV